MSNRKDDFNKNTQPNAKPKRTNVPRRGKPDRTEPGWNDPTQQM